MRPLWRTERRFLTLASKARRAFDKNANDVRRLLDIHADIGGDAKGRRYGLEVLNKSALVLITAVWEAYCEDLASEALEHLVTNVSEPKKLPKELKKKISAEIKTEANELAMWDLAGDGWKDKTRARLASLTIERNRKLNTPKSAQIDELFAAAIGLTSISSAWKWKKMSVAKARAKLDSYVTLRGEIAHRGTPAAAVKKANVTDFFSHVERLVRLTGGKTNSYVKATTGKGLW
jgi:hypothetical protein